MALTKADMTEQLYEELGFNKREVKRVKKFQSPPVVLLPFVLAKN